MMDISVASVIFWGGLAAVCIYAILIYNNLVSLKHAVSQAWANIDVLLKQRHDELPKLIETCKQYMAHEKDTLERVIRARSKVSDAREHSDVAALGAAETQLRAGIGGLFALAENYPDLKADEHFRALQTRITGLENEIADRREYYNASVNANNVRIEQFPDAVIAQFFRFKVAQLLKFKREELKDVDVKSLFGS